MDEKELLKERFKSAISSAVKAISENFELEIKFSNQTWWNWKIIYWKNKYFRKLHYWRKGN